MIFSGHFQRKGNKRRDRRPIKGQVRTGLVGTVTRGLISKDVAVGTLQDSLMSEK